MAAKTKEEVIRELKRRDNDQIKVHNFLNQDFSVVYDGYRHTVPAQSDRVFARYIAGKFMTKIVDHKINIDEADAVERENKRRVRSGQKEMDPQEREQFDTREGLRTNNEELRAKYMAMTYKGVVERYGEGQDVERERLKPVDNRPADVRLLEELEAKLETEPPLEISNDEFDNGDVDIPGLEQKKEELMKEVA